MRKQDFDKYINEIKHFNLQDLKWDNIEQWPTLARWAAPVLLFLGVLFLFNFFYLNNVESTISEKQQQQSSDLRSIGEEAQTMANYRKMEDQIESINKHFEKARDQFPDNIDINALIEKLLSNHGVENIQINQVSINNVNRKPYYNETPIKLNATGGYHAFGQFITHLANSEEMFTIESFLIQPKETNSDLKFSMEIKAYENNNQELEMLNEEKRQDSDNNESDNKDSRLTDEPTMDLL